MSPETTYALLLAVQAGHLLHHRVVRRHISYAEGVTALVLCVPPTTAAAPAELLVAVHLTLAMVQIIGSLWIHKLAPR